MRIPPQPPLSLGEHADSLEFAYCPGIGLDNALIYLLHRSHLESTARVIVFFYFSTAFIQFNWHCWGRWWKEQELTLTILHGESTTSLTTGGKASGLCVWDGGMQHGRPSGFSALSLPFNSLYRTSDTTSLNVTSRSSLMMKSSVVVYLRRMIWRTGRSSLTLSSSVNSNTSYMKQMVVDFQRKLPSHRWTSGSGTNCWVFTL